MVFKKGVYWSCLLITCIIFFDSASIASANNRPPPRYIAEDNQQQTSIENTTTQNIDDTDIYNTYNQQNTLNISSIQPTQVFDNQVIVKDNYITAKVIDYPVIDLLNTICNQLDRKIIISSLVQEKVSLQVDNISLEELLSLLTTTTGITWLKQQEIIVVSQKDNLLATKFFPVKYTDLNSLQQSLSVFNLNNKIVINSYPRGLLISTTAERTEEIQEMITLLDVIPPKIKVEFQVVEVNKGVEKTLGIAWQDGDYSYTYKSLVGQISNFDPSGITKIFTTGIIGSAQKNISFGRILARPYIITTHGKQAYISTGDEIPIFGKDYSGNPAVEYKRVGIELYVTPSLLEEDLINIDAKTIVNIISGQVTQQGLTAPKISSREASTIMQVKSGEIIVIGGLIKQEEINSVIKVPILGKIPILGNLFKRKQKSKTDSEILIFITPTLLTSENTNPDYKTNLNH